MDRNIYINKELYSHHFDSTSSKRRLDDFIQIYNILKTHLEPKSKARINETKMFEYVSLYKEENRDFIKRVYIQFSILILKNFVLIVGNNWIN